MDAREVVMHEMQRDGMFQILDLLREGIGQAREAAILHADSEVLPFDVAG